MLIQSNGREAVEIVSSQCLIGPPQGRIILETGPVREAKSMWVGFVMNLLIPGLGYGYFGRPWIGVACFIIFTPLIILSYGVAWFFWALVMGLDMRKFQRAHERDILVATTKKCPNCAELVLKEARICRFCQTRFV